MNSDDLERLIEETRREAANDAARGGAKDETRAVMSALRNAFLDLGDDEIHRHPHAAHLERVAREGLAALPAELGWIEEHLAGCEICRRACAVAESTLSTAEPTRRDVGTRLWHWLSSTVFHPALAAAYLVALVLVVGPTLWKEPSRESADALVAPQLVFSDPLLRSAGDGEAPLRLSASALAEHSVHLVLQTDRDGLDEPTRDYRLTIRSDDTTVWTREFDGSSFSSLGVTAAILPARLFDRNRRYRLSLVDRATGTVLLERSFEFVE